MKRTKKFHLRRCLLIGVANRGRLHLATVENANKGVALGISFHQQCVAVYSHGCGEDVARAPSPRQHFLSIHEFGLVNLSCNFRTTHL